MQRRRIRLVHPFQNRAHGRRRAQHPFPIIRSTRGARGRATQLLEGRVHGFQFYANHGRQIGADANVLFEGRKKTGKGHAQGVETGEQLVPLENALRVRQQARQPSNACKFGNKLNARAHLRRARSVTHHPRKLAEHRLGLRGRRFDSKGRNRSRQDQGPQDSELPLFHVLYLPGAVLAVVLASGAAFTVKSAVREMV